jgi:hypothetical protein
MGIMIDALQNTLRSYWGSSFDSRGFSCDFTNNIYRLGNVSGTAGQQGIYINASGQAGIGTTNPSYLLDVNGTARVQNDLTLKNGYVLGTSFTNQRLGLVSGSAVNSFFDLYPISATGGIDVGFTVWSKGSPSSITNYELLEFRYDNTNRKYALNSSSGGTGSILPIDIYTGANTSQFRLATSGNVLVGTTTDAGYKFDVNGTVRVQGTELRLDNATTGTINIYSATPTINFFSGGGYTFGRSATTMTWNSAGSISLQIGGNGAYSLDATNGHVWRTALSGGAATARLDTGGSLSIGNGANAANASSILDLTSTTKGLLLPRMTTTQVNAIVTPANGLLVYNTTIDHFCGYQAGAWVRFSHSPM